MRLKGKVAVITGGTSGIGRRMVERFVEEGAAVYFSGRRAALGAEVAQATGATFVEANVTLEADAARTIATAAKKNGRVDVLINNAGGVAVGGRLEAVPLESFDATIAAHVRGALAHIKHVSALMRAQQQGSIINIGSVAGHRAGYSSSISYGVAKAALIHLSRCAAMELGEDSVRVNSISPGGIATGIFGKAMGM
ncbi:MAG: SDR family oxidoreductase, partial [Acidobacteriota bacterium]